MLCTRSLHVNAASVLYQQFTQGEEGGRVGIAALERGNAGAWSPGPSDRVAFINLVDVDFEALSALKSCKRDRLGSDLQHPLPGLGGQVMELDLTFMPCLPPGEDGIYFALARLAASGEGGGHGV